MADFGPNQFGRWLVVTGLLIAAVGLLVLLLGRFGLFRLPGDITIERGNWRVFVPLGTSVVLSILLTLLLLVLRYFRR